jgi:dTDP-4-dehydrorhamnose reductase
MPQTAVIIGRAGQLGTELCREFAGRGWEVKGFDRKSLNIANPAEVESALTAAQPDLVLNAAAYNHVDVAEREPMAAYMVNGLGVRNLAVTCRQLDAKLVHFSTDYVFDGTAKRPYTEADVPHPLSAYGVSKLAGEYYARAYLDRALVIRTSGVFGPAGQGSARGNFVELMLRLAAGGQPIRVVEDHVASPTYAPELARLTADLVAKDVSGVVHGGGETPISWYEYAKMIFGAAGLSPSLRSTNEREYRTAARRPKFSALANARAGECGIAPMPALAECVRRYLGARVAA